MNRADFESAVAEALDSLPLEFAELMSNVAIQVHETPDRETLLDLELDDLTIVFGDPEDTIVPGESIVLASNNPGKVREINELLGPEQLVVDEDVLDATGHQRVHDATRVDRRPDGARSGHGTAGRGPPRWRRWPGSAS